MDWFQFRFGDATAFGRETEDGFLVRQGSTAIEAGSAIVRRDARCRGDLISRGVLKPGASGLLEFHHDHVFNSPSQAAGVVKDGNCSGPENWKHVETGETLKDYRSRTR